MNAPKDWRQRSSQEAGGSPDSELLTHAARGERIDWRQFEQLVDELLPIVAPGSKRGAASEFGQYVRGVFDRVIPVDGSKEPQYRRSESGKNELFQPDITVTERFVKVRLRVPEYIDPRKLQLFINGQTLKIEGPLGHVQLIDLPAPVSVKSGLADFREQTLHIRLRKRTAPAFKELYVRY
ncbi:MAG: hypothetical protein K0Q59_3920 [Paenibacillus sp.]|nr:hypothetical protein [Paenibacillus sp.]